MLTVTFNFHDSKVELPEKSGEYIVVVENNWTTRTSFSLKWGKFNVSDCDHDDDTAIDVFYWAEIPIELQIAVKGKEILNNSEDKEV